MATAGALLHGKATKSSISKMESWTPRNLLEKVHTVVQDSTAPCKDPEPTKAPSPSAGTSVCLAKCLFALCFSAWRDVADERKAALGTAQLLSMILDMIYSHTALAFEGHRSGAEAGPGCGVTATLSHGSPQQEQNLCGHSGCRADVAPGERCQGGHKCLQPSGAAHAPLTAGQGAWAEIWPCPGAG